MLTVVLLLGSATVQASADSDYKEGVELFKSGDYQSAITSFETAQKKGMESAALFYNLGSAYFKIGQYSESRKYFTRVLDYPDKRALAEFNLGLIALEEHDRDTAMKHFEYVETASGDEKIVELTKLKMASLRSVYQPWRVYLLGNIGYDDNISVTPDNLALGVEDSFYSVYASADVVVRGNRKRGWLVNANYFNIDFSDSDNFDQDYYSFGLRNERRLARWDTVAHLSAGRSSFGGEDLQSFYKLDVHGSRALSSHSKIILQYRYDDFTSENPAFDYLEGWRQRAQIRYLRSTLKNSQQVYYEAELNSRGDLVTPTFSYNFSPTRHTLGGKYTHKFSNRWFLTGDIAYRVSDFPASPTVDRDDTRWTLAALLDFRIDPSFLIKGSIKYIQNDSSFDLYTYDKTVYTIGVSKLF